MEPKPRVLDRFVRCLRRHVTHRIPEVTTSLVAQAKGGHITADRLILDTFGPKAWLVVKGQGEDSPISFEEALRATGENLLVPTWAIDESAEQGIYVDEQGESLTPKS